MNGRNSRYGDRPAAFITMISESVASLVRVWEIAIISAIGAMISTSAGITRPVMPRKVRMVWPWLVIRSMPRNACVIQITPVRLIRTSANDASVVRKMYLSIDPIATARSRLANRERNRRPILKSGSPRSRRHPSGKPLNSHYHPVDPSTKWLAQGALRIWLIIHSMWPSGHARGRPGPDYDLAMTWLCGGRQAIVGPKQLPDGRLARLKPCRAGREAG